MRQRVKRFLSIFCIMTVIASLVTVMPVNAEEVQGTETGSAEAITKTVDEVVEDTTEDETASEEQTEIDAVEFTETEAVQTDTEEMPTASVSGNDAITQTEASTSDNEGTKDTSSNEAAVVSDTVQSYTDEQGNVFTYELDAEGNATIIGITVSGAALTIPETINEVSVIAVVNGSSCVVTNPTVKIPELTINCKRRYVRNQSCQQQ